MNLKFIFFIAGRYLKTKRKSKNIASSFLSIIGITVGVMTLTVVIGIMNGFQLSFIEPILNINSFHLQVSGGELDSEILDRIRKIKSVKAVIPYVEYQAILEGEKACLIRGIPANIREIDPSFKNSFKLQDPNGFYTYDVPGESHLKPGDSIMIANQLAGYLGLNTGDPVSLLSLSGDPGAKLVVSGIFKTGYSIIDESWGFISMETAENFGKSADRIRYGIKLKNRYNDMHGVALVAALLDDRYKVESWRIFNSKLFGTLLTEKILMMLVIGLIFIVVGFNIFHSLKRSVMEKIEEIALLKALGTATFYIKNIFIMEGFFIGFIGVLSGTILGFFLTYNINEFFAFIESLVNQWIFPFLEKILDPLPWMIRFPPISIFSPSVFYMDKVPVRVLLEEAVFINAFAMICCIVAAYFASKQVAGFKPAKILRYE